MGARTKGYLDHWLPRRRRKNKSGGGGNKREKAKGICGSTMKEEARRNKNNEKAFEEDVKNNLTLFGRREANGSWWRRMTLNAPS